MVTNGAAQHAFSWPRRSANCPMIHHNRATRGSLIAGSFWRCIALLLSLATPAFSADLRLGLAVEPDSIDPHFHNFGGNKGLMPNLFEALSSMDPQDHLTPNLAVAWRLIDDATWEFQLRPDVT